MIEAVDRHKTWTSAGQYVAALELLALGPNVAAFLGHSDMRAAAMGLDRATRNDERPTAAEQTQMERWLTEALDAGFVGMSSQQLLFDKLDGDVCRSRTLPSTYAKPRELRRLKAQLRQRNRVLQSGPDIQNPLNVLSQAVQSLGILRRPLSTSLLSAADIKANPYAIRAMGPVASLVNKLGGNFRWQHLPVPFEVRKDERPTAAEQVQMDRWLTEALDAGFVGMSSQQLLFDKLDGDACRSRTLPSTYAKARELRRLKSQLRQRNRVLQSGPDIQNPLNVLSQAVQSLGILRRPLSTSLLSAADIKANPYAIRAMGPVASLVNKLGGNFRWQHLPVPFEVYADGIDLVIFEEFGAGAAALHLRDEVERNELLRDEKYRRRFRKEYESKFGVRVWHRDFFDAEIVSCPDKSVLGKSFGQVGMDRGGLHPVDAFLDLVLEHGTAMRWRTTISNHRPEVLKQLAQNPGIQIGFSDAGAHLRNMAFYNFGLRLLRHVREAQQAGRPFMTVEQAVHRLTGELADWYQIDAGHLRIGDRADLFVIDPEKLDATLTAYAEEPVDAYGGLSRMVNRNDATVRTVLIGGQPVVVDGQLRDLLGKRRTGRFLPAGAKARAVPVDTAPAPH
ncbi:N-acyl-D-aspartate/D-glutamate deacylase [Mycobacteroides abscessus]|nr:N-acyl-D-aspartate/D-glutamate deacylase [Mycobacteroides abscessus]